MLLYVDDSSIQIPAPEVPIADHTTSPVAIDIPASEHQVALSAEPLIDKLVQGVHAAYEADKTSFSNEAYSGNPWRINVGEWDAYVYANGNCLLRAQVGESKQTVCRFNLHTGEVAMPLKAEQEKNWNGCWSDRKNNRHQVGQST